jgi:hypothetical protein
LQINKDDKDDNLAADTEAPPSADEKGVKGVNNDKDEV